MPSQTSANTPAPADTQTAAAPEEGTTISAADTILGRIVVDSRGYTLYMSTLDRHAPPVSVCVSAQCLTAWKPVQLKNASDKPSAGDGLDSTRLGSFQRADGTWQATLGGWPLYRFEKDRQPGQINGQGLKGTWYVLSPAGKRVTSTSSIQ
ncbi:COG4315 family predicted lipoprotein [Streptomyces sp. NPDC002306]